MGPTRRAVLWLGGTISALAFAGCTYSVDVYNRTPSRVSVSLIQTDPVSPDWILDEARVAPGERVRLGPARLSFGTVVLEAVTPDEPEVRARLSVGAGHTVISIRPEGPEGEGTIALARGNRP